MTKLNLGAATLDIVAVAGDDRTITITASPTSALDNATVTSSIAYSGGTAAPVTQFTASSPSNGVFTLSLTDAQTTSLGSTTTVVYWYWVRITIGSTTTTWLSGSLTILPALASGTVPTSSSLTAAVSSAAVSLTVAGGGAGDLPPAPSQVALSTNYAPSQLTMKAVHLERSRDILPQSGPHAPLVEEFLTDNDLSLRYTIYNESGTATTETVNQGVFSLASTGGCDRVYRSKTKLPSASGVFTSVRVDPGWVGGGYVCCGFYAPSAGGEFIHAQWRLETGALAISTNLSSTYTTGTPDTIAGPTTSTGPLYLGLLLSWPSVFMLTSSDGRTWDVQSVWTLTRSTGLTDPTVWDGFRPGIRLVPNAGGTLKVSRFVAGFAGSYGFRDQKPVTFADGTPLRKDGRYFVTGTVAHGSPDFRSNHMAVFSFDPVTYQTDIVCHLFYDVTSSGVGAAYGGQVVYDETTGIWTVLANSWGFDDQDSGVDLLLATTTRDLTEPGVVVLKASRLTGISTNSLYDGSLRKDGSTWKVAAIETDARTGWTTSYPVLLTGSSLNSLSIAASDVTTAADGTCWMQVGGTWYIIAGASTGFVSYSAALASKTALTSWSSGVTSGLLIFGTFPAHPGPLVVDDGHRTRYLAITHDDSRVLELNASRGGLLILEADEKPTGQEFAPKFAARLFGS